jgi:hypothetical protein
MSCRRRSAGRFLALALGFLSLGFLPGRAAASAPLGESVWFGAYAPGLPYYDDAFLDLEKKVGAKLDIASGFVDWDYVLGEERDVKLAAGGRVLLYSWEPHCDKKGHCISFKDVARGRADEYLGTVADSMKRFPGQIYVRPWAEMNAHWSPYQPGSKAPRAGSIAEFKAAWRYLYDFFRARGVHNLKFVFTPDVGVDARNVPIRQLWPGRDPKDGHGYVDVLGMDGYNWGDSKKRGGDEWLEFEEVFAEGYRELTALDENLPVWVCEFGSKEPQKNDGTTGSPAPPDDAHDKGAWIENMFRSTAFPRLQALAYYSAYLPNHDNQRDFRFDSSASSLKAVRAYLRAHRRPSRAEKKTAAPPR